MGIMLRNDNEYVGDYFVVKVERLERVMYIDIFRCPEKGDNEAIKEFYLLGKMLENTRHIIDVVVNFNCYSNYTDPRVICNLYNSIKKVSSRIKFSAVLHVINGWMIGILPLFEVINHDYNVDGKIYFNVENFNICGDIYGDDCVEFLLKQVKEFLPSYSKNIEDKGMKFSKIINVSELYKKEEKKEEEESKKSFEDKIEEVVKNSLKDIEDGITFKDLFKQLNF